MFLFLSCDTLKFQLLGARGETITGARAERWVLDLTTYHGENTRLLVFVMKSACVLKQTVLKQPPNKKRVS